MSKGKATSRELEQIKLIAKWGERIGEYKVKYCDTCKTLEGGTCRYKLVPVNSDGGVCSYYEAIAR